MFPVGIVGKSKFRPYATFIILVINVLVFLVELVFMVQGESAIEGFLRRYAFNVCAVGHETFLNTTTHSVMSLFLHGSLAHLAGNMVFLWLFAPKVEAFLGHRRFIIFYLMIGVAASFAHAIFGGAACPTPDAPGFAVGASGAIAGVLGGFMFLYPGAKVRTAVVFLRGLYHTLDIPAFAYLGVWILQDVVYAVVGVESNVAHSAHIGGFVIGLAVMFIATLSKPAPKADPFEYLDD